MCFTVEIRRSAGRWIQLADREQLLAEPQLFRGPAEELWEGVEFLRSHAEAPSVNNGHLLATSAGMENQSIGEFAFYLMLNSTNS